jgi:hypothetical protein
MNWRSAGGLALLAAGTLFLLALRLPPDLREFAAAVQKPRLLDRNGQPLNITYSNELNLHDLVALEQIPPLLIKAFVAAEDRRFWLHRGIDWAAKLAAVEGTERICLLGDGANDYEAAWRCLGSRASLLPPVLGLARAGFVALAAAQKLAAGQSQDLYTAVPVYLRGL